MTAPLPAPPAKLLARARRLLLGALLACLWHAVPLCAQGAAALSITAYPATLPGVHPSVVAGANALTLPVGHLKRGFYLLSLTGGQPRRAAKVVLSE
jgi:hypothetical protein